MTLAAPSSSGRPWLSEDICRGSTRYKGSYGWLKFSSMMLALISLYGEWAVLPLKRSLRANQWSQAHARSHKFRVAHGHAAPASSDAPAESFASTMANQYFYVRGGVRPQNARRRAVRETTRGRAPALKAERTPGAAPRESPLAPASPDGDASRRRAKQSLRPPPRERRSATLTLSSHRNPRMPSSARTSSRPSATRRARCKCCTTSSRPRNQEHGSRSSSRLC
jgi:hypothetical protein